ncbi:DUF309 domain-containing protein [Lederbergia citrea]|uniref:DUF309 domain-containing protein n=1 Tax=Lederbergia citrea TaxID=2833581 RepID=UPI002016384E|nr:DUF309 domain-containing protein [Lederbergia citrea]
MGFPTLYINFLIHFHGDRDYFECHEVLEEHWKNCGMHRNSIWVGLIQVAVSFYHYRRGNKKGAVKMMDKAVHLLTYKQQETETLGINHQHLITKLKNSRLQMMNNMPYMAINLPINNRELLNLCVEQCVKLGYEWGDIDDHTSQSIIHKHKMRDRSDVVAERKFALEAKSRERKLLLA